MTNFEKVKKFMLIFRQDVKNKATMPDTKTVKLRLNLIKEEVSELETAINENNIVEIADALTDILYVTYGAGHAFGINLDKCFEEVQKSNLSKLDKNGKPIFNDSGKIMKGENYLKPDLNSVVYSK